MKSLSPRRFHLALGAFFVAVLALSSFLARAAHAGPSPVDTTTAGVDTALEVWRTAGPLWAGLLVLYVALRAFVVREQHLLGKGRLLAVLTGGLMVLAAVLASEFEGAPSAGIWTALLAAIALLQHPTVPSGQPSNSTAGPLAMLLFFALGVGLVLQPACGARQRGASAAAAFIDCEAPDVAKLLPDLIPIAKEAVMAAIAGDGSVDTARLRADAEAIRGDLAKCAIAAAIAALATPAMARPDAPMSAALVLDAARLRGAFAQVRGELGWAEVHVAGTVL